MKQSNKTEADVKETTDYETVTSVFCHQSVNVPTVANEKTVSDFKYKGIKMFWTGAGVTWEVKGLRGIIPAANCANVFFK